MSYLIWELYPEFFRGRWVVLHHLATELHRPELEPPPVKQASAKITADSLERTEEGRGFSCGQ
jgi:hypothetical protein